MYITGIIAEYNPFHNGHLYHLHKAVNNTNADLVIVVMSGCFVQRGEPAIIDKWLRTKMALEAGADIVVELPTVYATSSAEGFAYGSILTLCSCNADYFVCGSESTDITSLYRLADITSNNNEQYQLDLKGFLADGLSYAKANELALCNQFPKSSQILSGSNNILTLNYLKALLKLNSKMKPMLIKRVGANYNDGKLHSDYSSATAIRKVLPKIELAKHHIPNFSYDILKNYLTSGGNMLKINTIGEIILTLLRRSSVNTLRSLPDMETGLGELLINNARKHSSIEDFINACTSKRYQRSRIKRSLIRLLLNIHNELVDNALSLKEAPYIRILGFNKQKSALLKEWRSNVNNVIQRPALFSPRSKVVDDIWQLDLRATDIYCLHTNSNLGNKRQDYTHPLIIH